MKRDNYKRIFISIYTVFMSVIGNLITGPAITVINIIEAVILSKGYLLSFIDVTLLCVGTSIINILLIYYIKQFFLQKGYSYKILLEKVTHKVITPRKSIQKRKYIIKPQFPGLTRFVVRYYAINANIIISQPSFDDNYSLRVTQEKTNIYGQVEVEFSDPLEKDKEYRFEIIFETIATNDNVPAFFDATIEEPTAELILIIEIEEHLGINQVKIETSNHSGAKTLLSKKNIKLDSDGRHIWKIKNPILHRHYEINWKYMNHKQEYLLDISAGNSDAK